MSDRMLTCRPIQKCEYVCGDYKLMWLCSQRRNSTVKNCAIRLIEVYRGQHNSWWRNQGYKRPFLSNGKRAFLEREIRSGKCGREVYGSCIVRRVNGGRWNSANIERGLMSIIGWMIYHVSKRASRLVLMNYLLSECQPSHNHRQAVNSRGKNLSRDTPIADLSISLTLSTEIQSSSESHPESDDKNFQFCDGVLFMWEKSWTFTDSSVYEKGFTQMCRLNSTEIDLLLANR